MQVPEIRRARESSDFHDSSLIDLRVDPYSEVLSVVLSVPTNTGEERLWQLQFVGLLQLELRSMGNGRSPDSRVPPEIYDVYSDDESEEFQYWASRLALLEGQRPKDLKHVVLASSYLRGWDDREGLEGISIVCRSIEIGHAPSRYQGHEYSRPRIEGEP
jgi:hypothetical protein